MKLQLLRNHGGKLIGVAFVRDEASVIVAQPSNDKNYMRICDLCGKSEAVLYCRAHSKYVCNACIAPHAQGSPGHCSCISMAMARDLAFGAISGEARIQ